jgi:hypothetical protein
MSTASEGLQALAQRVADALPIAKAFPRERPLRVLVQVEQGHRCYTLARSGSAAWFLGSSRAMVAAGQPRCALHCGGVVSIVNEHSRSERTAMFDRVKDLRRPAHEREERRADRAARRERRNEQSTERRAASLEAEARRDSSLSGGSVGGGVGGGNLGGGG